MKDSWITKRTDRSDSLTMACHREASDRANPPIKKGWRRGKAFRTGAVFLFVGWMVIFAFLGVFGVHAYPIGFLLNGMLEAGANPVTPLAPGSSASLPIFFDFTLPGGDTYQVSGKIDSFNAGGGSFSWDHPYAIEYVGNAKGGTLVATPSAQTDTFTVEIHRAFQMPVPPPTPTETLTLIPTFALHNTAPGSSAEVTMNLAGQTLTFISPVAGQEATLTFDLINPLPLDFTHTFIFGAGSPVGSYISYFGAAPSGPAPNPNVINLGIAPVQWNIAGAGDFNGDGDADLVWENTSTGQHAIWFLQNGLFSSSLILPSTSLAWRIAGVGDFDGDGNPDLVWENVSTGQRAIWLLKKGVLSSTINLPTTALAWHIAGAADFINNGFADLVWENTSTGRRAIWLLKNGVLSSSIALPTAPEVVGKGSQDNKDKN
jgi:VCBS repeat protein